MGYGGTCGIVRGTASVLILLLLGGVASAQRAAQSQKFKNIELCNRVDRNSPDIRINGCTALIDSGKETPRS